MPHLGELLSSKNEQRKHPVCTSSPLFFPLCFCSPGIPADLPLLLFLVGFPSFLFFALPPSTLLCVLGGGHHHPSFDSKHSHGHGQCLNYVSHIASLKKIGPPTPRDSSFGVASKQGPTYVNLII